MLRLLDRLVPVDDIDEDDADLALGRSLVGALMELAPLADPGVDLRLPMDPVPPPRTGLAVHALFGNVSADRIACALTAIVAAGLAGRARDRARIGIHEKRRHHPPPISTPAAKTSAPPSTTWNAARRNGVCM